MEQISRQFVRTLRIAGVACGLGARDRRCETGPDALRAIARPLIREVRGKGLLIGIEIDTSLVSARALCERLAANGALSKDTHQMVVRSPRPLSSPGSRSTGR